MLLAEVADVGFAGAEDDDENATGWEVKRRDGHEKVGDGTCFLDGRRRRQLDYRT
jgi:hypothetical protein